MTTCRNRRPVLTRALWAVSLAVGLLLGCSGEDAEDAEAAAVAATPEAGATAASEAVSAPAPEAHASAAAGGEERTDSGEAAMPAVAGAAAADLPALPPLSQRPPVPDVSVTDIAGREIALAGLDDQISLIVFWATWCRPCLMEIPHLVDLTERFGNQGFQVLGLSIDRQGIGVVKPFLEQHPEINYTIVPNGHPAAAAFGGIQSIPTSFLVDRNGRVIRGFRGLVPGEVLEGYVRAALAES